MSTYLISAYTCYEYESLCTQECKRWQYKKIRIKKFSDEYYKESSASN